MNKQQRAKKIYNVRYLAKHGNVNGIIFMINNILTGEMFIGSTRQPLTIVWSQLQYKARNGTRGKLFDNMREHGIEYFDATELYTCDECEDLKEVLQEFLLEHSPSLNSKLVSTEKDIYNYL